MKKLSVALFIMTFLIPGCARKENRDWTAHAIRRADVQMRENAIRFENDSVFPRSWKDGNFKLVAPRDWTSGFFPGSLWRMYEFTGDGFYLEQAKRYTQRLDGMQFFRGTHDIGFIIMCSFGNQYANLHDEASARAIADAANSLISRFDERIGLIRSWNFGRWNYPVIIDNMMNLELLFRASELTGDSVYRDIAVRHADLTMKNHFRDDYSSYHVVSYLDDGTIESRGTHQGYADDSAWARGQAWALYGYTMCYRETGLQRYLDQAEHIAAFVMNHPRTPEDLVPYWDYDAPGIPGAQRDASAGAIYASALLELSTLADSTRAGQYFDYAERLLKSLSSDAYLAPAGGNGGFVIMHCVGNLPSNSEVDTPLNYADYYYLEALQRYVQRKNQ